MDHGAIINQITLGTTSTAGQWILQLSTNTVMNAVESNFSTSVVSVSSLVTSEKVFEESSLQPFRVGISTRSQQF